MSNPYLIQCYSSRVRTEVNLDLHGFKHEVCRYLTRPLLQNVVSSSKFFSNLNYFISVPYGADKRKFKIVENSWKSETGLITSCELETDSRINNLFIIEILEYFNAYTSSSSVDFRRACR